MDYKIYIKKPIEYYDENNGYYTIKSDFGDQIINNSGKQIVDSLYDGVFIQNIINYFMQITNVDFKTALLDVFDFLSSLKIIGLLEFDAAYFESYLLKEAYNIAGEKDYVLISEKIIENFTISQNTWYNFAKNINQYNAYVLRAKCFAHQESYFYSCDNDEISSIIGLTNMSETDSPVCINLIQTKGTKDDIIKLYNYIEEELIRLNKYKIRIIISSKDSDRVEHLVKEIGFFKEGVLEKEDRINDYFIFSKLLNKHEC